MKHLILTRFNLRIWKEDKHGKPTLTDVWLHERVALFEHYCLPSMIAQTCQDFRWIILFDYESPEWLLKKVDEWVAACPQIRPVSVKPANQGIFRRVFREVAISEAEEQGGRMLTTYLDNDDALRYDFVADVQQLAAKMPSGRFISYHYGLQYFTEMKIATLVHCKYNHFPSYVEDYEKPDAIETFFKLVSHAQMKTLPRDEILHIENPEKPMWMEVVHPTNKYNDVHVGLRTRLVTDKTSVQETFGTKEMTYARNPKSVFSTQFLPRFVRQFFHRVSEKIFGIKLKN